MKNPNNNSIIYLAQNEKFFTLSLDKNFDINMKILADIDNNFITTFRRGSNPSFNTNQLESIIGLKHVGQYSFPKHINIKTIVNV